MKPSCHSVKASLARTQQPYLAMEESANENQKKKKKTAMLHHDLELLGKSVMQATHLEDKQSSSVSGLPNRLHPFKKQIYYYYNLK